MATAPLKTKTLGTADQPLWNHFFDSQTEHELIDEDLHAGRNVCGVLISIVVGGLLLGITAVLLTL